MNKGIAFALILSVLILNTSFSQTSQIPEVGKAMPNFVLNNITHYKTTKAALEDFKGKWLFLDFWFQGCAACIQSFPSVNAHYKKFKDSLNWVLVGLNDQKNNKGTQAFYEKLRAKRNLEMPAAYDSVLSEKWNIYSMPHIVIVNPKGIVHSITSGRDMTSEKIEKLLRGENVTFYPKDIDRPDFKPDDSVSVANATSDKMLYRSVLSAWKGETQRPGIEIDMWNTNTLPEEFLRKGYTMSMIPLYAFYNYAYWGRWSWGCGADNDNKKERLYGRACMKPILEMKDTSLFVYDFNIDVGKGTYNYSLTIPISEISGENIKKYMQEDLRRAFKYEAGIETRKVKVWKLIAKPGVIEKLKTKGEKRYATPGSQAAGYTYINWPKEYLIGGISYLLEEKYPYQPFVDETGLTGNFDFTIEADMTDINDVRKELQKQGLDLVEGEKEMKVLVIRDPKKLKA